MRNCVVGMQLVLRCLPELSARPRLARRRIAQHLRRGRRHQLRLLMRCLVLRSRLLHHVSPHALACVNRDTLSSIAMHTAPTWSSECPSRKQRRQDVKLSRAIAVQVASLASSTEWSLRIQPVYIKTCLLQSSLGQTRIKPFNLKGIEPQNSWSSLSIRPRQIGHVSLRAQC